MLFVPSGLKDGPLPTQYEPIESPVLNPLYGRQINPTAKLWRRPGNELHLPQARRYPYVFTTYRLTELHCGGSRPADTAELQPEAFVEISPEFARELRIARLGWTVLSSLRGEIEVRAMVTQRLRPFVVDGRIVHEIGMPWHSAAKAMREAALPMCCWRSRETPTRASAPQRRRPATFAPAA